MPDGKQFLAKIDLNNILMNCFNSLALLLNLCRPLIK